MALNSPNDLFMHELSVMYDAEHKIAEILRDQAGRIQDKELAQMLREHELETREQIANLELCFENLSMAQQRRNCAAIDGIRADFEQIAAMRPTPDVLAMAVVASALKVEHFEIATYRGLVDKAMQMGENECAQLLQSNLVQEEETAASMERVGHDMSQQMLAPA